MSARIARKAMSITGGAIIPPTAQIIFNLLTHYLDPKKALLTPGPEVFDVGAGCAFSLIGICIATKDTDRSRVLLLMFVILLLTILGAPLFMKYWGFTEPVHIWPTNFICIVALAWAIADTEPDKDD